MSTMTIHANWLLLGLFCVLLSCSSLVSGDDSVLEEFDEFYNNDEEYRYRSHRDIKIKYIFLNRESFPITDASYSTPQLSPSKDVYSIPFNKETSVLITVRNNGRKQFNLTHLTGYLHAAHSFDFLVENYTERVLNVGLNPQSEITLEYRFEPWNGLATVDYVFSCDLGYILPLTSKMDSINDVSDNQFIPFQTKFANQTITVYDAAKLFDFQLFFMWILIIAFWAAAIWAFYELYYVPDQLQKGNQVPSTMELISSYGSQYFPSLDSFIRGSDGTDSPSKGGSNRSKSYQNDRNTKSPNSKNDDWLVGTTFGKSNKNKPNQKKNKKKNR